MKMSNGWPESARAWIAQIEDDYSRKYVLDQPMLERIEETGFRTALDVGCGEGRFCRMLRERGLKTVGIDPTEELIQRARSRDPGGDYRTGRAEALDFPDGSFDLVISYLTLIDIADFKAAIAEMARVLAPMGTLLIANLASFCTAAMPHGWVKDSDGESRFYIDNYLDERAHWLSWKGIRIRNWHRPLSAYMSALLGAGMELRRFSEPEPRGGDPAEAEQYKRVPPLYLMEWQKRAMPTKQPPP